MKKTSILFALALTGLLLGACSKQKPKPSVSESSEEPASSLTSEAESEVETSSISESSSESESEIESESEVESEQGSEEEGFTVTFETNGGTPVETMYNVTTIETSPVTTKEGYTFLAWYRNASFLTKVNFPYTVTKDLTLYAKWEEQEEIPDGVLVASVDSGVGLANAYMTGTYGDDSLNVTINVRDKTIYNLLTNQDGSLNGMNDNVELFVSPLIEQPASMVVDETVKIMVIPDKGYEVRHYQGIDPNGNYVYSDCLLDTGITSNCTLRNTSTDGYNGYSVNISVPYSLFGLSKASAIKNIQLYLAMRNSDSATITKYMESNYLGALYRYGWTHFLLEEDGTLSPREVDTIIFGDSYVDYYFYHSVSTDFKGKNVYDYGIGGSKALEWNNKYFDFIRCHNPKKVVINIGVNDVDSGDKVGEVSYNNIIALVGQLHGIMADLEIYWITISSNYFSLNMSGDTNMYDAAYEYVNTHMKSYAEDKEYLHIIDFAGTFPCSKSMFISDGLHLNPMGYNVYAKAIYEALGFSWEDGSVFGQAGQLQTSRGYDLSDDSNGNISSNGDHDQYAFVKTDTGYDNFSFTASLSAKAVKNGDPYPKMGIVIKSGDDVAFFYVDMFKDLSGKTIGLVRGENHSDISGWEYNWKTAIEQVKEDIEYVGSNSVKLSVEVDSGDLYCYVNDTLIFSREAFFGISDPLYPGLMSFNTAFEATNISLGL